MKKIKEKLKENCTILFLILGILLGVCFKDHLINISSYLLDDMKEPQAILLSALIATVGVGLSIRYQRKSDRSRNITEYIASSRIDWGYRVREYITDYFAEFEKIRYYMAIYARNNKEEYKGDILETRTSLQFQKNKIQYLLNIYGEIDMIIISLLEKIDIEVNKNHTKLVTENDIAKMKNFILCDSYTSDLLNSLGAIINLYLKLEWERVKKEIDNDREFNYIECIDNVKKNLLDNIDNDGNIAIEVMKLDNVKIEYSKYF